MAEAIHPDDLLACRRMLAGGSRSFHAASLLLPRRVMEPATALYAFCRIADDLVDDGGGDPALQALRHRLDRIYAGTPAAHPADRALSAVVARHRLPRALLDDLLEGFAWDGEGRRYATLAALQGYAARVAGTVGAMMAVLMGVRDTDVVARACDLGVAMQLSNIARDVGEDARAGRLYLPLDWLQEAGIDPVRFLAQPAFSPALGQVVQRLVGEADRLYARADAGIAALPLACRPGIGAARRLYAGIGHRVAARAATPLPRGPWCPWAASSRRWRGPWPRLPCGGRPSQARRCPPSATWSRPSLARPQPASRPAASSGCCSCSPSWTAGNPHLWAAPRRNQPWRVVAMGRWEWIIMEVGFVALLGWELFSVRRSIRRARHDKALAERSPAAPALSEPPGHAEG